MRVFGGNLPCYAIVQNNKVTENSVGIAISLTSVNGGATQTPTILNNTISQNSIGISLSGFGYDSTPTIQNNNLQDNTDYNFYHQESNNANVSYNWWGTTDESTISKSIYDYKNDFNFGVVTFKPILTSPNTQAANVIIPNQTPTATENPNTTPTPTSTDNQTINPSIPTNASTQTTPKTNTNSIILPLNAFISIIAVFGLTIIILTVLVLRQRRKNPIETKS
jgi:parallel beta-helix repeat protein